MLETLLCGEILLQVDPRMNMPQAMLTYEIVWMPQANMIYLSEMSRPVII